MILAGDIGATHARLAMIDSAPGARVVGGDGATPKLRIVAEETYPSAQFGSLIEVIHAFRNVHKQKLERAGFGVAGPVNGGVAKLTNLGWAVDAGEIAQDLAIGAVAVVNDLEATAHGIGALEPSGLVRLSPGATDGSLAKGSKALIAAGTGLGHAALAWNGREHIVIASEAGHAGFAPADERQEELLHYLRRELGAVCVEHVVSGPGLYRIYRFLRDTSRGEEPTWLADEIARGDPAAVISRTAMERRSKLCEDTLELFVSAYGSQAGNFALSVLAQGGMYVAGGIAPRILPWLRTPEFLRAFADKGDLSDLVRAIPVHVIVDERVALLGAASASAVSTRAPRSTPLAAAAAVAHKPGTDLRVSSGADELARAACEEIVTQALDALALRGRFTIALTGGTTPKLLYAELAASGLPWDKVQVFFGDERCVPPDHAGSNYRMARETLLSKIPIPATNVHRMKGELEAPGRAALEYEAELRRVFEVRGTEIPVFDVVLLGMGADGHVASLFPGSYLLDERGRLVASAWVEKVGSQRITLTLPVINAARNVFFLVSGRDKAQALREVLAPDTVRAKIPARMVDPKGGRLVWFVDQDAASA